MDMAMRMMTRDFFAPLAPEQVRMVPLLLDRMQLYGIGPDELRRMYAAWIDERREAMQQEAAALERQAAEHVARIARLDRDPAGHRLCPDCGRPLTLLPINDRPATMVGGNYMAVLLCRNPACLYTEYLEA